MKDLILRISDHPVLKTPRSIRLKQISHICFDLREAKVTWEEIPTDQDGQVIIDETVSTRKIVSDISNSNVVNEQGVVIDSETYPKLEDEEYEDYQKRIEELKSKGFPEFDFYIGAVLNVPAIAQAIELLDSLKRFNRK
jgi:hypothetical protein